MPTPALTDEQCREAWAAYVDADYVATVAADALGLSRNAYANRLGKAKQRGFHLAQGMQESMVAAKLDGMAIDGGWIITDKDGEIIKRSTRFSQKTKENDTGAILDAIRDGLSNIPLAAPISAPQGASNLCAVFPVADLHIGLLTDEEETGTDWNGKIAGRVFAETFGRLVSVTPSAGTAILAQLGDLTHTDDQRNVTPQSGHQLDADTRYFMILRRAVAAMKWAIDTLRAKYPRVIYRGCRGNHDITAHYAVTLALTEHYRDVEGVTIIDNAGEFYCHEYGANMILLHHGDRAKPDRLVHFAAAQWPEMWGRTKHRLALSGHVHHETVKEIGGMKFESLGTIIPRDAYAIGHAYSARRALVSITLDKEQGEVSRSRVGI
jgi:hypothetical protein